MASYKLVIKKLAAKELRTFAPQYQKKIYLKIGEISQNPLLPGTIKLKDADDLYRVRVGIYRIVYKFIPFTKEIYILRIRHRKDAYKNLP